MARNFSREKINEIKEIFNLFDTSPSTQEIIP